MKDILGNEISVGDIVAHGQRSGNGGSLGVKIVVDKRTESRDWSGGTITSDEVRVVGYEPKREWDKAANTWRIVDAYHKLHRPGWTSPDVLVVLDKMVAKELKEFLSRAL